jgi:hypothetical protein
VGAHLVTLRTASGSDILTRRELALAVGGYDEVYKDIEASGAEDLDFELKLAARCPLFVVSEYLVGYRVGHGSMSRDDKRMMRALRAVINKHVDLNCLPKIYLNWAFGEFHKHYVFVFLGKRKFGGALKAMVGLMWNDPAVAARVLFFHLPERVRIKIVKVIDRARGNHPQPSPHFYDISPSKLFKLPRPTGRWDEKVRFQYE